MTGIISWAQGVGSEAIALSKKAVCNTTVYTDLDQAQSLPFVHTLKDYSTAPERDGSSEVRDLVAELQTQLLELETKLEHNDAQSLLSNQIRHVLSRWMRKSKAALGAFDKSAGLAMRLAWGTWNGLLICWEIGATAYGQEKAYFPQRLSTQTRSICIFAQYLLAPAPSNGQLLDMTIQRTTMNLPNQITYTTSFFVPIYGTTGYKWGTIAASLALVALIIIPKETILVRDRWAIKANNKKLQQLSADKRRSADRFAAQLRPHTEKIKSLAGKIQAVKSTFKIGHGTNSQHTRMQSSISRLLRCIEAVSEGVDKKKVPNEDAKIKFTVVGFGGILVAITLISCFRNPVLFVQQLQWAVWYTYRLVRSAVDPAHQVRDTLELASIAGAVNWIALPFVSIPLLVRGADAFDDKTIYIVAIVGMLSLNLTISHMFGPWALAGAAWTEKHFANSGAIRRRQKTHNRKDRNEKNQMMRAALQQGGKT